jgi:hypothetical protein
MCLTFTPILSAASCFLDDFLSLKNAVKVLLKGIKHKNLEKKKVFFIGILEGH